MLYKMYVAIMKISSKSENLRLVIKVKNRSFHLDTINTLCNNDINIKISFFFKYLE